MIRPSKQTLILGAGPRLTCAISRSLWEREITSVVATPYDYEGKLRSKSISKFIRLPGLGSFDNCRKALLETIDSNEIDFVVPTGDGVMNLIGECYQSISERAYIGCPAPEIMEKVLNKTLTIQAAEKCGVNLPQSIAVNNSEEAIIKSSKLIFPIIAKPNIRKGSSHYKVKYFSSRIDLELAVNLAPEIFKDVLLQEYFSGVGIGVGTLFDKSLPVATFQHRRVKEYPYTGGVSVTAISEKPNAILREAAYSLLEEIGWQGIAMIEFKYDPHSDRYVLMEINGRYWGSLFLTRHAGLNFPYYEWALAHGITPIVPREYRTGIKSRWFIGDCFRLKGVFFDTKPDFVQISKTHEVFSFFTDFITASRGAIWSWRDPWPAIDEITSEITSQIKSRTKVLLNILLPDYIKRYIRIYRSLGSELGYIFLVRHIKRLLRVSPINPIKEKNECKAILFVCLGNIIRSPMAEALIKKRIKSLSLDVDVFSAGTWRGLDKKLRKSPEYVQNTALKYGVSLDQHVSQRLTHELADRADIIFVMDYRNEAVVINEFPEAEDKVFLIRSLSAKDLSELEIMDPYGLGEDRLECCFDVLNICTEEISRNILSNTDLLE